ncbi:MAG: AMP-binding protein, partial [Clostridia bacterium]|nr:AMP-binding protein [Clostridia bacterium]
MSLLDNYIQTHFDSYDEFRKNYKVNAPADFNFAYDVVDKYGTDEPDRRAMLWVSKEGEERTFTFGDMKRLSNKAANALKGLGIKKGDPVMLVLKRRYQFWYTMMALHKLGAIAIPGTFLLTDKEYVYRANAAGAKLIVCVNEPNVTNQVDLARERINTVENYACVGGNVPEGFLDYDALVEAASDEFEAPVPRPGGDDTMLLYFTSGTTGYPKMVCQDYFYAAGHIPTAWFWHCVKPDGLHFTISDTGWGKAVWGKLYGQWFSGAAVLTYDFDKFVASDILEKMVKYRVTTFCAPPTMYRYMIKEPLEDYDLSSLTHATTAGEALNPEVFNQFKAKVGLEIHEGFGQTESTLMLATFPSMKLVIGSMGRPVPGWDVRILDHDGNECAIGDPGEMCVYTGNGKPMGMFKGYYQDPELTKTVWHDDFYHTGDVAWKDSDGYFWYVGRA